MINLSLNIKLAKKYKSNSQKIRVLSEDWVKREVFCPACGKNLINYENNRPVNDFFCPSCSEDYELKSKKISFGNKIVDGSFNKMIEKVQKNISPNFFLMNYNTINYSVTNLFIIPKHFFVPEIIEKRK
ncbi:MAG: DpnI domain-containing protein [candidate division Zixibacteria bacterium]|nr:DpnI domain-containing protein [candidate division Zixibacteria bacterium]